MGKAVKGLSGMRKTGEDMIFGLNKYTEVVFLFMTLNYHLEPIAYQHQQSLAPTAHKPYPGPGSSA
jgi:hypothetical protein